MSPIERIMDSVDDPGLIMVGAKIITLLADISNGKNVRDNTSQLQKFTELAGLPITAERMVQLYAE
jgi:hypothetical protein